MSEHRPSRPSPPLPEAGLRGGGAPWGRGGEPPPAPPLPLSLTRSLRRSPGRCPSVPRREAGAGFHGDRAARPAAAERPAPRGAMSRDRCPHLLWDVRKRSLGLEEPGLLRRHYLGKGAAASGPGSGGSPPPFPRGGRARPPSFPARVCRPSRHGRGPARGGGGRTVARGRPERLSRPSAAVVGRREGGGAAAFAAHVRKRRRWCSSVMAEGACVPRPPLAGYGAACAAGRYTRPSVGSAGSESPALCPGGGAMPAPEASRGVPAALAVSSWLPLKLPRFPAERGRCASDVRGPQALGRVGRVKEKGEPPPGASTFYTGAVCS